MSNEMTSKKEFENYADLKFRTQKVKFPLIITKYTVVFVRYYTSIFNINLIIYMQFID